MASMASFFKVKVVAIILAATVVVGAGGTAIGVAVANTPENLTVRAMSEVFENLDERQELELLSDVLTSGSFEFALGEVSSKTFYRQISNGEVTREDEVSSEVLFDGEMGGKLYFGQNKLFVENLFLKMGEESLSADAYLSEDTVYLREDSILGGGYMFKAGTASEQFKNSIFAYGSNSEFAIQDEEIHNLIVKSLDASAKNKEYAKDVKKLTQKLVKDMWKIVCENAAFEAEKTLKDVDGKEHKVRVVTISITGNSMAKIIEAGYDYLLKDEEIVKFLEKHEDRFVLSLYEDTADSEKSIAELYKEELVAAEEYVKETAEDIRGEGGELKFELITPTASVDPISFGVYFDDEQLLLVDFGLDGFKKSNRMSVKVYGEEILYFNVIQNDKDKYLAEIVSEDKVAARRQSVCVEVNKQDKTFTAKFEDNWGHDVDWIQAYSSIESAEFRGTYSKSGKVLTINLSEMEIKIASGRPPYLSEDARLYEMDVKIVLNPKDKMPSLPKDTKQISDITDEDINKWIEKFEEIGMYLE